MLKLDIGEINNAALCAEDLQDIALAAYKYLGLKGCAVLEVDFITKEQIRELNLRHREKDAPTDVLSFPLVEGLSDFGSDGIIIGNVVICTEAAKENATEYGHSVRRELLYLFAHGLLHILGFDHIDEKEKVKMRETEEYILKGFDII